MRTKRTPLKLARDRVSTIAWIHAVRAAAAIKDGVPPDADPLALQKALVRKHRREFFRPFHRSHRIRDYFKGKPAPGSSTLKLFERVYPGTVETFEHGPDHSHLWDAVFCRDTETAKSALFAVKNDIQQGIPAERSIRRRRRPGSHKPSRAIARVIVPVSLARALRLSRSARLDAVNAALARQLKENPKLADSLSTLLDSEDPRRVEGPLVQTMPDVTFSAKARRVENVFVRPSYLAGFALQLLHARIYEQSTVILSGWDKSFTSSRLRDFGLDDDEVERLSGVRVRFSRPTKPEVAVIRLFQKRPKKSQARSTSSVVRKS